MHFGCIVCLDDCTWIAYLNEKCLNANYSQTLESWVGSNKNLLWCTISSTKWCNFCHSILWAQNDSTIPLLLLLIGPNSTLFAQTHFYTKKKDVSFISFFSPRICPIWNRINVWRISLLALWKLEIGRAQLREVFFYTVWI